MEEDLLPPVAPGEEPPEVEPKADDSKKKKGLFSFLKNKNKASELSKPKHEPKPEPAKHVPDEIKELNFDTVRKRLKLDDQEILVSEPQTLEVYHHESFEQPSLEDASFEPEPIEIPKSIKRNEKSRQKPLEKTIIEEPPRILFKKTVVLPSKNKNDAEADWTKDVKTADVKINKSEFTKTEVEEPAPIKRTEKRAEGSDFTKEVKHQQQKPTSEFVSELQPPTHPDLPVHPEYLKELKSEEVKEFKSELERKEFEEKKGIKYEPEVSIDEAEQEANEIGKEIGEERNKENISWANLPDFEEPVKHNPEEPEHQHEDKSSHEDKPSHEDKHHLEAKHHHLDKSHHEEHKQSVHAYDPHEHDKHEHDKHEHHDDKKYMHEPEKHHVAEHQHHDEHKHHEEHKHPDEHKHVEEHKHLHEEHDEKLHKYAEHIESQKASQKELNEMRKEVEQELIKKLAEKIRQEEKILLEKLFENEKLKLKHEREEMEHEKIRVAGIANKYEFKEKQLRKEKDDFSSRKKQIKEEIEMEEDKLSEKKADSETLSKKLNVMRADYETLRARMGEIYEKLRDYEKKESQLKQLETEIERKKNLLAEAQKRLEETESRIKEKGFSDYLETEVNSQPLVSSKFKEKNLLQTNNLEIYNLIDECKANIKSGEIGTAKSIYMQLRNAYSALKLSGSEKDILYTAIRELYDDIHLAEMS